MNFSLMPDELPDQSLRRIVLEQIDGAIDQLQRAGNLNDGIHEARKHFKRIRAVLRLGRGALPPKTYRRENLFYRDQGRILSPVRDSAVHIETFDMLTRRYGVQMSDKSFIRLRHALVKEHRALLGGFAEDQAKLPQVIESLNVARLRVPDWKLSAEGFAPLARGLRNIYRRGREEKRVAYAQPTTENLHAWRKRVKYLWYHFQILQPIWPALMKVLARECDLAADRLGQEHDLAMLQALPCVRALQGASAGSADLLSSIVARERTRLRRAAVPSAARIYAERPGQFANRIESYLRIDRPLNHSTSTPMAFRVTP